MARPVLLSASLDIRLGARESNINRVGLSLLATALALKIPRNLSSPVITYIERYYGFTKENRSYMEHNNTYMGHDIVATLDILYEHSKTGKWSDVLNI